MEEEEISDALYGDLGDFEFNQKLKEQNDEITRLTERLNQSVVTITDLQKTVTDLQKENRRLKKNASSLLLTARTEVNRKQLENASLQQKNENRIFRRKNNHAIGVQTDVTIHPFYQSKVNGNNVNGADQSIVEKCTQINFVIEGNSIPCENKSNGLNNFRIPKKNAFARHVDVNEPTNPVDIYNTERLENSKVFTDDQSKKYHLPKKNPHARRLDIDEERYSATHKMHSDRIENDMEKSRHRGRRDDIRDNRKHSPAEFVSSRRRDTMKTASSDDRGRYRHRSSSRRKHSRGRESSDERDRHSKRLRSDPKSYRDRSKSKPSRNEAKHRQSKSPKKSNSRSRKDDRIRDEAPTKESVLDMKEKELEAMLIAQTKILQEIDSKDDKEPHVVKENSLKQRHKRKMSTNEDSEEKFKNQGQTKDILDFTAAVIPNFESGCQIAYGLNDTSLVLAKIDTDSNIDRNNVQEIEINPANVEALSNLNSNFNEEKPPVEFVPETNLKFPLLVQSLLSSPIKKESEMTDKNEEPIVGAENQLQNNDNSNSQMDIDYELMGRTSTGDHFNPTCDEVNKQSLIEDSLSKNCLTVNTIPDSLPTQINASFISIESNVPKEDEVTENKLNGSFERHIVSKSCEYTVQDDGNEVRIYLTKKRRKNKQAKVTS